MKTRWTLALGLLAGLAFAASADEVAAVHPDRFRFEIQIERMVVPPGGHPQVKPQFMITTIVKELETGKVVFAPRVAALSGIRASVQSGDSAPSCQWKATYMVDSGSVSYSVEGTRDGEPLYSNTGSIRLEP